LVIDWNGIGELGKSVYGKKAEVKAVGEGINGDFTAITCTANK